MFSKATEYALRATIYIAQRSSDEAKLGIEEISRAIDSPQSFTAKILHSLTKDNSIVYTARGPNGGYYIPNEKKSLPVRSILVAMGEDELLGKCILGLSQCSETNPCPMHSGYKSIKQNLITLFETKTIQQLADETKNGEVFLKSLIN